MRIDINMLIPQVQILHKISNSSSFKKKITYCYRYEASGACVRLLSINNGAFSSNSK